MWNLFFKFLDLLELEAALFLGIIMYGRIPSQVNNILRMPWFGLIHHHLSTVFMLIMFHTCLGSPKDIQLCWTLHPHPTTLDLRQLSILLCGTGGTHFLGSLLKLLIFTWVLLGVWVFLVALHHIQWKLPPTTFSLMLVEVVWTWLKALAYPLPHRCARC